MKKNLLNRSLLIIMMIAAMSMSTNVFAQGPGQGKGKGMKKGGPAMHMKQMIPDLTEDQMTKIKSLRLETMKETTPLKAQMKEKKAHLNTLAIAEKADMKAIEKTIDEMGAIRVQMMKAHAKMRQGVRAILTDDQRVIFDSKAGKMMSHGKKGHHGPKSGPPCKR